jgi:hypothetical protein
MYEIGTPATPAAYAHAQAIADIELQRLSDELSKKTSELIRSEQALLLAQEDAAR